LRPKAIISRIGRSSSTISTCLAGIVLAVAGARLLKRQRVADS
jgi:hypothetical protein